MRPDAATPTAAVALRRRNSRRGMGRETRLFIFYSPKAVGGNCLRWTDECYHAKRVSVTTVFPVRSAAETYDRQGGRWDLDRGGGAVVRGGQGVQEQGRRFGGAHDPDRRRRRPSQPDGLSPSGEGIGREIYADRGHATGR